LLAAGRGEMRRLRRDMQIIFQDPFASLDPRYRVEDIIAEPLIIHSAVTGDREGHDFSRAAKVAEPTALATGGRSRAGARRARVAELLRAVGLDESILRRFPHEFSGGQRQRIGIARALALRPKFIVCDEPVSALDVSVGAQIVNLLAQLQRDFGLTYLFISHSMPVVRYLSTRIAVMYRGKIVEVGDTEQITARPAHAYTRSLLEATPELTA
jgi:ABC-type glutathione transport system ATPase component